MDPCLLILFFFLLSSHLFTLFSVVSLSQVCISFRYPTFLRPMSFLCFTLFFLTSLFVQDDEDVVKRRGPDGTVGRDLPVT